MSTCTCPIRKSVKELFDEKDDEAKPTDVAATLSWEDLPEDGYFGMYTHFSIHETMLKVRRHVRVCIGFGGIV